MKRRQYIVYGLLFAAWAGLAAWQIVEHVRVTQAARAALINRARDITSTVGLVIRSQRRWGTVSQERLESALNELVKTGELKSVLLLNAAGAVVTAAGDPVESGATANLHTGEQWGDGVVTLVNLVDLGTNVVQEGEASRPIIVLPRRDSTAETNLDRRGGPRPWWRPGGRGGTNAFADTNALASRSGTNNFRAPPPPEGRRSFGRPPGMSEEEFQSLIAKQGLHSFVVVMSTESLRDARTYDFWLRAMIGLLAGVAVAGYTLAWRNVVKSSELQLRLVRASELNNHLKKMNIAAAGLAHETRNPLNIIRGLAQMVSKQADASPEVRTKAREITDEVDRVTAQLNEFINYSKPREVRRAPVVLGALIGEVVRALQCDLDDKSIQLTVTDEGLTIEADEQLLRQLLFNLLLNAIQAVDPNGKIHIVTRSVEGGEALLDVRDDGPGVPAEQRQEIFKPYFTTHQKGTGLGLAVVQQIVLAHGWDIQCLGHEPRGAIFRLSHLKKLAA